jgi:hypothetical protein
MFYQCKSVGLEHRRAGSAEEILDSVIAAARSHPTWYFKECLKLVKMLMRPFKRRGVFWSVSVMPLSLYDLVWIAQVR